jgi:hypothetical protein
MKKVTILLSLFVYCGIFHLQAQTVQISGTVISSEDNLPVPGASVVVRRHNDRHSYRFQR